MNEVSNLTVCLAGVLTVFFGLVCIVLLCKLMSAIIQRYENPASPGGTDTGSAAPQAEISAAGAAEPDMEQAIPFLTEAADISDTEIAVRAAIAQLEGVPFEAIRVRSFYEAEETPIANRQEILAAVSTALAEYLETDVSGIRVRSFRRV